MAGEGKIYLSRKKRSEKAALNVYNPGAFQPEISVPVPVVRLKTRRPA
jgi:hypothetical protein